MKTSGARDLWLDMVASAIMDSGSHPLSMSRLVLMIPSRVGATAINDGHVTAAIVFGEERRKDYKAGQCFIIEEMVQLLIDHNLVIKNSDETYRWIGEFDGEWKLNVDGRTMVVYGQRERRLAHDQHMLGERDEETGATIGQEGIFACGESAPFDLIVQGPRGGQETLKATVHPLALTIPPMTEAERESLRASIARDGVRVPLVIYQKKILDGRNRGYFASVLKKPVKIEEFTGTEEEAKRYVAILNLHRRHLNETQRSAIAFRMFGEETKKEAAMARKANEGRPGKLEVKKPPVSGSRQERKWHEIAARKAKEIGINVSPNAIRMAATIVKAPKTSAAVERGEIKMTAVAYEKALEELGLPVPDKKETVYQRSINNRLGLCVGQMQAILKELDETEPLVGQKLSIVDKLDCIEQLTPRIRNALRRHNIDS